MKRMKMGRLLWAALALLLALTGCGTQTPGEAAVSLTPTGTLTPDYAQQFSVEEYAGGYRQITVADGARYLVVPQGAEVPDRLPEDTVVLQQPLDHIYLAATAAMDLFRALDRIEAIRLSGTDVSGWTIEQARQALESGQMLYAGKYSAPDYETILENDCDLAVESTMIYHAPEVKEQLESLEIPVFVDYSSYEANPLGRMEWIKLYGILLGREEQAQQIFADTLTALDPVLQQTNTGKTAAFFYITSTGTVNVRKSGDYVATMIGMAGGSYLPRNVGSGDSKLSTMNMDMESFYAAAKDADVLIYNSTIDGELQTLDQLRAKSALLDDFKAVQTGNVWCTGKNMFQESMGLGNMILDLNAIFTQDEPSSLHYLTRLR